MKRFISGSRSLLMSMVVECSWDWCISRDSERLKIVLLPTACLGGREKKNTGGWAWPVPVPEQLRSVCSVKIKYALGQGVNPSPIWLEFRCRVLLLLLRYKVVFPPQHLLPVYAEINARESCLVKEWYINSWQDRVLRRDWWPLT